MCIHKNTDRILVYHQIVRVYKNIGSKCHPYCFQNALRCTVTEHKMVHFAIEFIPEYGYWHPHEYSLKFSI